MAPAGAPNLDVSLDELIAANNTKAGRRGRGRGGGRQGNSGGNADNRTIILGGGGLPRPGGRGARRAQGTPYAVPAGLAAASSEGSKIMVSNLHYNVTEADIKVHTPFRPGSSLRAKTCPTVSDREVFFVADRLERTADRLEHQTEIWTLAFSGLLWDLREGRLSERCGCLDPWPPRLVGQRRWRNLARLGVMSAPQAVRGVQINGQRILGLWRSRLGKRNRYAPRRQRLALFQELYQLRPQLS
ncbi:MAG: hypothetical protein BJ554DRAFT_654 [Olpidium bornovanus]|uniref:Uncharacterized protein n=1 Tax=Olpidium bornovanus TaxID=278681 RepID=A0A8H7ZTN5_9FUNG|nr:MAG: hypothetical protein BJ554DRAFT_654 [Olpidium bornovanus]